MEHAQQAEPRKRALSGRALGLVLIFLTAIIWVAASFISQLLVNTEEGRPSYNVSPFLLTYLSTSIFTIFLPLVQLKNLMQETWLLRRSFKYKPLDDDEDFVLTPTAAAQQGQQQQQGHRHGHAPGSLEADLDLAEAAAAAEQASAAARASAAAHKESLLAAAQCFMLWFIAQYLFNVSLSLTSVTSNTILSSTSSLFTFTLSMVVLKEPYSCAKLLSIAACIGGTLLVTLSDSSSGSNDGSSMHMAGAAAMGGSSIHNLADNSTAVAAAAGTTTPAGATAGPSHSVLGDLLCLVSACFYACYTIVLRKSLPDDDEANVALFFGYVGLLCSVVFAPVVAVLAGLGSMHLKTIPAKAYGIILVEGILNYCLSDYLWAHAVLLLGPTIATLGLSVQIPVAAVVEVLVGVPSWLSSGHSMALMLSGTGLIMAGFFAGNLASGGHVYGSHHRGDDETQQCRRSSDQNGFHDPDDALYDSSSLDGSVVIPVSTHASIRDRSPLRGNGSSSTSPAQQQQQLRGSSVSTLQPPAGVEDGESSSRLQQQQQQRLSVEMSSLAGSSRSSGGGGCSSTSSPSSMGEDLSPGADGRGLHAAGGSRRVEPAADGAGGGLQEGHQRVGESPVRSSKRPYRVSRLQKAS